MAAFKRGNIVGYMNTHTAFQPTANPYQDALEFFSLILENTNTGFSFSDPSLGHPVDGIFTRTAFRLAHPVVSNIHLIKVIYFY